MATITVRNLDDDLKARLRILSAKSGRSMEEEVRIILRDALTKPRNGGLGSRIRERFAGVDEAELELPERKDTPRSANFDS
ncbi:MAG TPA: TraY domain-containing protein [Halomonas sp.]|nr:TraY domain-containing protein [Halomonas sp.]